MYSDYVHLQFSCDIIARICQDPYSSLTALAAVVSLTRTWGRTPCSVVGIGLIRSYIVTYLPGKVPIPCDVENAVDLCMVDVEGSWLDR